MNEEQKEELAHITVIAISIALAFGYFALIVAYLVDLGINMRPFQAVLMILPPLQFLVTPAVLVISGWKLIYIAAQKLRRKSGATLSWRFMAFHALSLELSTFFILAVYTMTKK